MSTQHYDVFVIGSGIAGQTAAKICAENGLSVAIADNKAFGGTCALRGCDPKKVLLQFATLVQKTSQLKGLGFANPPTINWKDVQEFQQSFTREVPQHTKDDLTNFGIDLYHESPKFLSESEIGIAGKKISANHFVIATGFVPRMLSISGAELTKTSNDIFYLQEIPASAVFIGAGYVGMEFGYLLATLGCKVTMIDSNSRALSQFDEFLVDELVSSLERRGMQFIFDAEVHAIEKKTKNHSITYTHNGKKQEIVTEIVFNTSGRVPAIELLDVDQAKIQHDETGIIVDEFLMSVSNKKIYACGDVSSQSFPLTPLSGLQGYMVGNNILNEKSKEFTNPLVPSVVFSYPNLASVGLLEEEAKKRYKNILVFKGEISNWYTAKKENADTYAYKIIANERTREIVGAHLLSSEANESINIFATAINAKMTIDQFKKMIFTYPSHASDLKKMMKES